MSIFINSAQNTLLTWHSPCIIITDTDSQSFASCSNIIKETLDKSMTQKDSLSKDLPQNPGQDTCFWNFHFYSGSQDTYSESQYSCCGCWHSHDTCHSHTYSRFDPPLRFCVGQVFGFSSRQNNKYCRRTGVSRATYATRYGSNWLRCHQSLVRGLCS